MQSNNKQLIEISRLAQALFHSRALSHKEELENTERIKAGEWKRILTGKERIESLGGNRSGFKIKLREVRDGGREGKRELRSAFNDDFFLSCSFHILFFFFLKVKCKEGKGSAAPSSSFRHKFTLSTSVSLSLPLSPVRPKASWIISANCERLSNFTPPLLWPRSSPPPPFFSS